MLLKCLNDKSVPVAGYYVNFIGFSDRIHREELLLQLIDFSERIETMPFNYMRRSDSWVNNIYLSLSQWPRGLRCRSAAAQLLRLWVRIPRGHGCRSFVSVV